MNSSSTHCITSRRVSMYEPMHQMNTWAGNFKNHGNINISASVAVELDPKLDNLSEDTSYGTQGHSNKYDQETSKPTDKVKRRLAQNREAARKSRLRKKAYVQQLESSRLKLVQLEQELELARQQGQYISGGIQSSHPEFSAPVNSGITAFEREYGQWVVEQDRQIYELRTALNANTSHTQLDVLVENGMNHYFELFRMKATAAKADAFYLISGIWKTPSERFFLWIGGFRPSELLKVILPKLDSLSDQQVLDVHNLKQSCQQAEDALSQGMDKLQLTVAEAVAAGQLGERNYNPQIANAMNKLEALVAFANQADHLRQEALQQMGRILSIYQTARCLLALGEYFQCLRALSSHWATRGREPPEH